MILIDPDRLSSCRCSSLFPVNDDDDEDDIIFALAA